MDQARQKAKRTRWQWNALDILEKKEKAFTQQWEETAVLISNKFSV